MKDSVSVHQQQTRDLFDELFNVVTNHDRRSGRTAKAIQEVLEDPSKIYIVSNTSTKHNIMREYNLPKDRVFVVHPNIFDFYAVMKIDKSRTVFDHYWVESLVFNVLQDTMNELDSIGAI